jgi:hypothetical protein
MVTIIRAVGLGSAEKVVILYRIGPTMDDMFTLSQNMLNVVPYYDKFDLERYAKALLGMPKVPVESKRARLKRLLPYMTWKENLLTEEEIQPVLHRHESVEQLLNNALELPDSIKEFFKQDYYIE